MRDTISPNVLAARIYLPGSGPLAERDAQFIDALLDRLHGTQGVIAAGAGNMAPLAGSTYISGFRFPSPQTGEPIMAQALQWVVTPGYAAALGLRLREGRLFTEQDVAGGTQVMLVNQEFTRQYLPSGSIVGRRYQGLLAERDIITEIVGVVGNVLKDRLDARPQPEIYLLRRAGRPIAREVNLIVRTSDDPATVVPTLRGFVRQVDPNAAIDEILPLAKRVSGSVSQPRFAAAVLAAFASLALFLAAVGLYGVLSYNVSQRRRELGIRAALGASRRDLLQLVFRQGLTPAAIGLVLGLAGAAALTRLMEKLLFGVTPLDAISFGAAPLILLLVAGAACLLPARRAAAVDPAEALRCE